MPEMFLHPSDVVLISHYLRNLRDKPRGMASGLWKRLKSDNRWTLERLSMADLRSLAIVCPQLMPEIGLWEPAWSSNGKLLFSDEKDEVKDVES